jgi:hypothetical protein
MSPEQRYRLDMAKHNTPSTSMFIWFIPAFLAFCWICKSSPDVAEGFERHLATIHTSQFEKYPHGDPVCGGDAWCFLGWHL